jgi:hypothetical protein
MISIKTTSIIINTITFVLAYLLIATGTNIFRTLVAQWCGDDTAKEAGFLTLNPLQHIDPIGLISLVFFHFGWPIMIPIDASMIRAPYQKLKLFFVYFSDVIALLFLSVLGVILLVILFDGFILDKIDHITSHFILARLYPHISSLYVVFGYICLVLVYLNTQLAVLHIFINTAYYVSAVYPEHFLPLLHQPLLLMGSLFVFAWVFSPILRIITISLITACGYAFVRLFGFF